MVNPLQRLTKSGVDTFSELSIFVDCEDCKNMKEKEYSRPIAYFSKSLNTAQSNHRIPELELLAVMLSLEHFRSFVFGYEIEVSCDKRSIIWLLKKDHPSKFVRYRERLAVLECTVKHDLGSVNAVGDWLSRHGLTAQESEMERTYS